MSSARAPGGFPGGAMAGCTPEVVLARVREVGPILLDPCTDERNPVGALRYYAPPDDGLALPWALETGLVYMNPPYSAAAAWAEKAVLKSAVLDVEIISLVAARPDSRWFYRLVWDSADAVCFWRGRLRFVGAPSSAPFPSAVVYHGPQPWRFESAFQSAGRVLRLR
jgi:phage N-6-adenine-methyltransferase